VLRTVELTPGFGQRTILKDVKLDVQQSVVTALLGPTGSGKTTLLRTFAVLSRRHTE
jgi:ABC-type transporter Mla maintaining outer membrane lipid asymmetry ATPase subunit MlaF